MNTIIIVSGHGHYATGFQSTIELLAGHNPDIYYLDLTLKDTDITLRDKMNQVIGKNEQANILFICDILGGTPFKVAAQIANAAASMEVIAGCNIGSILEGILQKENFSVGELAEFIVEASRRTTIRLEKCMDTKVKQKLDIEAGI